MRITKHENRQKIMDYVSSRLIHRDREKKMFGEVFTPLEVIDGKKGMLDNLPKSVWSKPHLKWLDPANGIGNFPICVYYRLMEGLKKVFPDKGERSRHIINNMLYMVELNPVNVDISRIVFCGDDIRPNIIKGDFLALDFEEELVWNDKVGKRWVNEKEGNNMFDVVMGNPPFNKPKQGTQRGSRAKNSLWDKFVINSISILKKGGYLLFIHPSQWRGLGPEYHKIWELLSKKQILYLGIYGEKEGKKIFNIGSRFDIYVLQNTENNKPTEVIDELGETFYLNLNEYHFLPNYDYDIIDKLLTTEDKGVNVIHSYSNYFAYGKNPKMNKTKTSEHKYPVVHSITQYGVFFWYANYNTKGHFGIPKVILNFNEHQYSHPEQNDYQGKYGMSQISFGIPIKSKEEGDEILKAIDTDTFRKIIKATKWGAFQTDYRMFKYFKPNWYKIILEIDNKSFISLY